MDYRKRVLALIGLLIIYSCGGDDNDVKEEVKVTKVKNVSPSTIGYLDEFTITGDFLYETLSIKPRVFIGGREQKVIEYSKNVITGVLNSFPYDGNLTLYIGEFKYEGIINISPPTIEKTNKESYDFGEEIILDVKNFFKDYVSLGDTGISCLNEVDDLGEEKVVIEEWSKRIDKEKLKFKKGGKLKLAITNRQGIDTLDIQINDPIIESTNKNEFIYGEKIILKGKNFVDENFSKIYVDNELIDIYYTGKVVNDNIELALNFKEGEHKLVIERFGQKSNEITFKIKETKINSINKVEGSRGTLFTIEGENLNQTIIKIDNKECDIFYADEFRIDFKLPFDYKLAPSFDIEVSNHNGSKFFRGLKGVEPHEIIENTCDDVINFNEYHLSFSDDNNWFFLNQGGVYKYSIQNDKWEVWDSNPPPINNTIIRGPNTFPVNLINSKAYFVRWGKIYIYDTINKIWEEESIEVDYSQGIYVGDFVYGSRKVTQNEWTIGFYKYNTITHEETRIDIPSTLSLSLSSGKIYFKEDKIFISSHNSPVHMYDIKNDKWDNLGTPILSPYYSGNVQYYRQSMYYYKDKLYLSGGLSYSIMRFHVSEYDFNLRSWKTKTPMLMKMQDHASFVHNNVMYFGLGLREYFYENIYIDKYYLNTEPL